MARRVLMAEVSGERLRGRPRLGWMDGVNVALGNSGMTVKAARQWRKIGMSGEALGPVFFLTTLPFSFGYHLERGGMPLHDAVGISCKKGETTESICAKGCMLVIVCVLSDLT